MSEIKTFKITGEIVKQRIFTPMTFNKEVKATSIKHAIEQIYTELGSRHRAKRNQITVLSIEEVKPKEQE
jgi:large subunit ribosomal protein LX